jgi:ankyrin repeat protein
MFVNPFPPKQNRFLLAAVCLLFPAVTARAEETPLREILRDGLYAEEVTRDPEAAAKHYEEVLSRYSEQRNFAAAALFRLAEVRRKQDRKEDAVKLYQQLLAQFPDAANETKLASENLAALGGEPAKATPAQGDSEAWELARLQAAAKSSPDVLLDPQAMQIALTNDWPKMAAFLLEAGNRPYEGVSLPLAVQTGNLEIVRLFLEKGGEVPPELARKAIGSAIGSKRPTILEFLLEKGLSPAAFGEGGTPPLVQALANDQYQAAEILLKHGADLNEMTAPDPTDNRSGGTPLHLCIWQGKHDAAEWLLKKGAKPDLATPRHGMTPLHFLVTLENPGTLALMEKLLVAGADPNKLSGPEISSSPDWQSPLNATPLETAIGLKILNVEKVELLLKHGGKTDRKDSRAGSLLGSAIANKHPNLIQLTTALGEAGMSMKLPHILQAATAIGDAELVSRVLKYGADPNASDEKGRSLLAKACERGDIAIAKALLDAGADPKKLSSSGQDLLRATAKNSSVEVLKLLADAGLAPSPEWKADRYSGISHEAAGFLLDRFVLPELTAETGAKFVMDLGSGLETVPIWNGEKGTEPPMLARWLLDRSGKMNFIVLNLAKANRSAEYEWSLYCKDGHGGLEKTRLDISGNEPFPALKSGDVILCRIVSLAANNISFQTMTPEMQWSLKKRIVFPITVTLAGESREVTVRGDRLLFDPTKPEVPLVDAHQVIHFLWQPPTHAAGIRGTILVKRKDWPEVRMAYGSKEATQFPLEPADGLTLELSAEVDAEFKKQRPLSVALKAVGVPYTRSFGMSLPRTRQTVGNSADEVNPLTLPTLIQTLIETQVPYSNTWKEWGAAASAGKADLAAGGGVFDGFAILPHPDLSRIRIRRLAEGDQETVIEIDLAAAISPDITAAAARKVDVILQGGDIVEIPIKDGAGPWKGFSEDEKRFFAKALAGKVQVVDNEGKISFAEIDCRPPDFLETASGWLPIPAQTGAPSARASWVLGNVDGDFRRGDLTRYAESRFVFLRNGDEWKSSSSSGQPRPQQPRTRVVPPPQPGGSNPLPAPIR